MEFYCEEYSKHYIKTSLLGDGTSGKVYLVQHKTSGAFFAAKFYRRVMLSEYNIGESAIEEIMNSMRVDHKYVMRPIAAYFGRRTVVIFPLMHEDLRIWIAREFRTLNYQRVMQLMFKILAAVNAIHSAGVIHRDLKPANIMMDSKGNPYIGDFGLSVFIGKLLQLKLYSAVQSLLYRAPEAFLCDGETIYDEKIDIWSLGCIFWELFIEHMLFRTYNEDRAYDMINNFDVDELKIIPRSMKTARKLIAEMLDHNPDRRPSAFEAMQMIYPMNIDNSCLWQESPCANWYVYDAVVVDYRAPQILRACFDKAYSLLVCSHPRILVMCFTVVTFILATRARYSFTEKELYLLIGVCLHLAEYEGDYPTLHDHHDVSELIAPDEFDEEEFYTAKKEVFCAIDGKLPLTHAHLLDEHLQHRSSQYYCAYRQAILYCIPRVDGTCPILQHSADELAHRCITF